MRQLLCFCVTVFIFGFLIRPTHAQSGELAGDAYQRGDYPSAIALYELALIENEPNGALYANLGHAYYMDGQLGEAMLNYLRAREYLPRQVTLQQQIDTMQSERIDGKLSQQDIVMMIYNFTASIITTSELMILALILWSVFFVLIGMRIQRGGFAIPIAVLSIFVILSLGLLGTRLYVETQEPIAVVITEEAQVTSGPGFDYLELFVLYEAIELKITDSRDGWVRFTLIDGRQGWIPSSSVRYIPNRLG